MKAGKRLYLSIYCSILLMLPLSCRDTRYTPPEFSGFDRLEKTGNRVIFIGDTQGKSFWEFWRENNKAETPLLLAEIARQKPACVINLGDLVFCGSSQKQWKFFDRAHQPFLEDNIPYFPLPGNHEYWCSPKKTFKNYFARFPHLEGKKWYSFQFQRTALLLLDTNFSKLTPEEKKSQRSWYRQELSKCRQDPAIDYIIVCGHNPAFTNSKVVKPGREFRRDYVEPFMGIKKLVLFFSGHCHSYEKFKKDGKYFIVSGGGGGPRQKLYTKGRKRRFDDLYKGPSLRFLNFCRVDIHRDSLNVRVIKLSEDGTFPVADEWNIPNPIQKSRDDKEVSYGI